MNTKIEKHGITIEVPSEVGNTIARMLDKSDMQYEDMAKKYKDAMDRISELEKMLQEMERAGSTMDSVDIEGTKYLADKKVIEHLNSDAAKTKLVKDNKELIAANKALLADMEDLKAKYNDVAFKKAVNERIDLQQIVLDALPVDSRELSTLDNRELKIRYVNVVLDSIPVNVVRDANPDSLEGMFKAAVAAQGKIASQKFNQQIHSELGSISMINDSRETLERAKQKAIAETDGAHHIQFDRTKYYRK